MWTVIYVASGWKEAEYMKNRLAREGLLVMLRNCNSGDGKFARHVELLVPEIEAREAHSIIMQLVGTARA
ncbi:MAG TPA: glutamate decarboxylase [Firmicutes bacterium]|uniref:Glutamate decarboxylase n=1 Tax=Candidatus Fermentithermobacillus carboniphilus TaxID=3085328 RepID=A0AAT9LH88_9FIRM|nr:MAG: glutamate decarboxylase [Candidatus Fermentithermobacillus carboniphilus]HHW18530.1 glutamate decarboxylase [Candidatus Fermentithermobacillaceae bacterium]